MVRTEYQAHLLDEYKNYLRKRVVGRESEEITMTRVDLAAALMRAFEKGVMKGILYESTDDISRIVKKSEGEQKNPQPKKESVSSHSETISSDEALRMLTSIFANALSRH